MQKTALLFVLLVAPLKAASGQALLIILFGDKLSTETFQLGINADLTWSGLSGIGNTELRRSWSFGAYGEIKLAPHWRLQPELVIKTAAGARNLAAGAPGNPFVPVGDPLVDMAITSGSIVRSQQYLSLPLSLKYVAGRIGVSAGAQVGFLLNAEDQLDSDVLQGQLRLTESVSDNLNTLDAGLVFGLDYALAPAKQMRSMRINVKYYYGLLDTIKNNTGTAVRNSILFVGLDIPVGGGSAAADVTGEGN